MKAPGAKQPHPHGREQAPYYERRAVLNVVAAAVAQQCVKLHEGPDNRGFLQRVSLALGFTKDPAAPPTPHPPTP